MEGSRLLSRIFLIFIIAIQFSACEFFGKKKESQTLSSSGKLSSGALITGTWSTTYASTSTNFNPDIAYTESLTFNPDGSVKYEVQDAHDGGLHCIGYGQFRTTVNDVHIYIQAVNSTSCNFKDSYHFYGMSVSEGVLEYTDSDDQRKYSLYMALNPGTQNLVGLWDFNGMGADVNGDGGLDWINFDQYGYFLLQTTAGGLPELIGGYYIVDGSHHVWLVFFSVSPAHPVGDPIEYSGYLTNGSAMDLYELDALGAVITYSGIKL